MKAIKNIMLPLFLFAIMASFSQCAGAKKLQDEAPLALDQAYFYKWVAGIAGGGSGVNMYIPVIEHTVALDSVYFRGNVAKLELDPQNKLLYIGRLTTPGNQKEEMIMHSDPQKEYGNTLPKKTQTQPFPFEIGPYECVISYKDGDKTKYFKIEKLIEKQGMDRPGIPKTKQ